jgi:flagellar hook-associated protein 3 FlgL
MRISFGHQYDVYRSDLMKTQERYFDAQRQVATGKRIFALSDDPFGAASALSMRQVRGASEQYAENALSAKAFLSFSEGTLAEMSTILKRVNELAVSGANGSTSQVGRAAMAAEITEIQKRLVDLANSKGPGEQYLFAGQATDTKPFEAAAGVLTYAGDNNDLTGEISANETMAFNTHLGTLMPTMYGQLESLKTNLQGGNLSAISGIDIGNIQAAIRSVDQLRGNIGTRIQTADQAMNHHERRMDDLTSRISEIEDADMSEAILQYKSAETAYQAALQTVSMGSQLSLMDFMR